MYADDEFDNDEEMGVLNLSEEEVGEEVWPSDEERFLCCLPS